MTEKLLDQTVVYLYGREVGDLTYSGDAPPNSQVYPNPTVLDGKKELKLARIYGLEYEGHYYDLAKPMVVLVRGQGTPAGGKLKTKVPEDSNPQLTADIMVWEYDKEDYAMCLDMDVGTIKDILLDPLISPAQISGQKVSGQKVSGQKLHG